MPSHVTGVHGAVTDKARVGSTGVQDEWVEMWSVCEGDVTSHTVSLPLPPRRLCSSPFSLSEEELLGMRQDVHSCFAQMDRSLALPRIRAHVLLQRLHTAWREAEFLKLDQALAAPELQVRQTSWWVAFLIIFTGRNVH